ncbi:HupE/UreJ family protein [Methylomonas koyamae]|uniref:HupE/UreJ family protein n=2 Tax=Methylomonas koyamae TaxID=702114 RepID=UPI0006CFD08B|nr:HupE/UreJ family protein [Methylomonas koyamae]BBL59251.1 membrane protein [Methylomonas koyamae]
MKNWALLCLWLCCSAPAMAHKASDSYLSLDPARLQGRWDIALRDLDYALGLDANGDGALTWGELRNMSDAVFAYAMQRLSVASAGRDCALQPGQLQVASHSDGNYAVLNFALSCPDLAGTWALDYRLFFDLDAQHRGLFSWAGSAGRPAIFGPDSQRQTFDVATEHSLWQVLASFAGEGAHHILIGYDHLLFLFSLLLPAGLAWDRTGWRAVGSWRAAALEVAAVVTAFTLAHSLTLSLTALHVIALPARWVEAAIAASVALAALNNIYPLLARRRAWLAFGFGLIHGMGIASVLLDIGNGSSSPIAALLGFNLGVEAGQLVVVALAFPLVVYAGRFAAYPGSAMRWSSAAIAALACIWLAERSLEISLQIF